ncbi:hypothetical protein [Chitinophaga filiformis]|uniref:hypothetical protein n=1 Tax=Chitinophaga filiformis TaxID=104663 RepID=UPI00115F81AC|nr:hypothetical protein [Chitinophaga filiformis]
MKTPKIPVRNQQSDSQEPFFSRQRDEHTEPQDTPTFFSPKVQRKPVELETDDPLEKEADQVADKVAGTKTPVAAAPGDTIQRKGTGLQASIQRKPGDGEDWKSYPIQIPPGTASKQEFHRYAELIIFHKVLNLDWQGTGTAEIYQHISQHIGRTILFKVPKSMLTQYGVAEKRDGTGDAEYKQLDKDSKDAINEETDKQYYQSTGIAPGTKIKPGEKGRTAVWNDLRNQLMQQRKTLNDLPPAIKAFLQSDQTFIPANYAKLSEIAALLSQFTAADFEDYQSKVNLNTTDLDALKQSIAAYMAARQERRKAGEERESLKTKLFGLEELYKRYKQFQKRGSLPPSRDEFGVHDPNHDYFREAEEKERTGLTASLKAYGFNSLDEFGKYVDSYEAAFRKETIAIAGDHLQRYRHVLFEEEKKIADDAYITRLFTEISNSGAGRHYEEASSKGMQAVMAIGTKDYVSQAQLDRQMALNEESNAAHATGDRLMQQLPSASPLMKEDTFSNESLARVKSKEELRKFLQNYIDKKKESIDETWTDINANPERVYELDGLVAASVQMQGITDGSIYDLIIKDKIKDLGSAKILKAVCFVVIGIALAVASFGTGIPALLAAGGSLALSAYAVKEEIEKYKLDVSAHDVELLTKEPSLTWVVLAIVGAGADAAALAAAFKAAGPIAKATAAFNESKDVVTLEKSLAQLAELDARIKQNIIRAAKADAALQESVDKFMAIGARLNDITSTVEAVPRLTVMAYNAIKKGANSFEKFLLDLKLKRLIKDAKDLSPKELNVFKEAFEKAGKATEEEIKAMDKLVGRADLTVANKQTAKEMMDEVLTQGKFNKASNYHGDSMHKMKDDVVQKIISNPDAIYETRNGERLIYLKDGDIVVMEATKSARGNVITAYGKSGVKGESGAAALGGKAEDAGEAVTDLIITEGKIPAKKGFIPPAKKIYP